MNKQNPSQVAKRKQRLVAAGLLVGVGAIASFGVWLSSDSAPPPGITRKADIKTRSYIAPGDKVDPQDAWRGISDTRLTQLEDRLGRMETENTALKKGQEARAKERSAAGSSGRTNTPASPEGMSDTDLEARLKSYQNQANQAKGYPSDTPDKIDPKASSTPTKTGQPTARPSDGRSPFQPGQGTQPPQDDSGGIEIVRLRPAVLTSSGPAVRQGGTPVTQSVSPTSTAQDAKGVPKTTQNYLPSGMFGQAVVLSGLDAPTGGQAQSNPHPVLLELRDLAKLPNAYRYDWQSCFVTGAGYGDISSERAYIRTENLSCVAKDGRVLDVPIKGYIAGEDGKAGMRGRLVSKQGQALANALLAGVVSGIGSGLEKSSTTTSVSPLGSTSTVKPGAEVKAGIGEGVGKALDRLANYYIALAEKMFPVVEVDAGRVVDVVLTKGVTVDVDVQQQ